jgi:hypothetical protein
MKFHFNFKKSQNNRSRGQILVEYLLLMTIAIACATLLTKALISRGSQNGGKPGIIIGAWDSILKTLGNDLPDCSKQTDFSNPTCPR